MARPFLADDSIFLRRMFRDRWLCAKYYARTHRGATPSAGSRSIACCAYCWQLRSQLPRNGLPQALDRQVVGCGPSAIFSRHSFRTAVESAAAPVFLSSAGMCGASSGSGNCVATYGNRQSLIVLQRRDRRGPWCCKPFIRQQDSWSRLLPAQRAPSTTAEMLRRYCALPARYSRLRGCCGRLSRCPRPCPHAPPLASR